MGYITRQVKEATELLIEHRMTSTSGCACGGVALGESYPEHIAELLNATRLLARMDYGLKHREMVAETHDRFSLMVSGNEKGIDKLRELLIPNREVRYIGIYDTQPMAKVEQLGYTRLKELRSEG